MEGAGAVIIKRFIEEEIVLVGARYVRPGVSLRAQPNLPDAPDLQQWIRHYGVYQNIPWDAWDRVNANYQLARRDALGRDRLANNKLVSAASGGSALTITVSATAKEEYVMATVEDYFASDYLRATDLAGKPKIVTIDSIGEGLFENDGRKRKKPIVYFAEPDVKPLVCNKTNFLTIASIWGDDTKDWLGKKIVIYPDLVSFRGKVSEAVRVRSLPKPGTATGDPGLNDTIPF
jgi:hypothetical protein